MEELKHSREEINQIDSEMARLFEARMKVSESIADYKKSHGLSIRDSAREAELIQANQTKISDPAITPYYVRFLKNLMSLSCDYQSQLIRGMRVAYCGTEGAFAHIAARRMFPEAELIAQTDFAEAYHAVEKGEYDCAVLPLENSYAGEVGTVMDLLFSGNLQISQVIDLEIAHHLMAVEGATLDTIKTVVSHPQALAQCDGYLRAHGFATRVFSNTALAARYVKESGDPTVAAIASEETAALCGLQILDRGINASRINTTRFAALTAQPTRPLSSGRREDENFILIFTVKNEAGALAQALNIIGAHGYNMRNLRSRPQKDLLWNYFFYIEAEGNINTPDGQNMLKELSAVCARLRLVGSYYATNVL